MESTKRHIRQYFDTVRMQLAFISHDESVVEMSSERHDYLNTVYENNFKLHRLLKTSVIQARPQYVRQPLMVFGHGNVTQEVAELDSLENENDSCQILLEHIRRLAEDPSLESQVSERTCLSCDAIGILMSLPIRSNEELVGMVVGEISSRYISKVLEVGNYENMVVLTNQRGDFFACEDLPRPTERWFKRQFAKQGVLRFFENKEASFNAEGYTSLWVRADIPDRQKWFLAFMYDEAAYTHGSGLWDLAGCT